MKKMVRKSANRKVKRMMPIFAFVLLAAVLVSLYGLVTGFFYLPSSPASAYKMEFYIKDPTGAENKIKECSSFSPVFSCSEMSKVCDKPGEYYSNAVTYFNGVPLSQSGWQLIYKC